MKREDIGYQCTECDKVYDSFAQARRCHPYIGGVEVIDKRERK